MDRTSKAGLTIPRTATLELLSDPTMLVSYLKSLTSLTGSQGQTSLETCSCRDPKMALHTQPSSPLVKKYIKVGTTIPTQVKNFSIGSTDSLETQQARAQVLEKSPLWE